MHIGPLTAAHFSSHTHAKSRRPRPVGVIHVQKVKANMLDAAQQTRTEARLATHCPTADWRIYSLVLITPPAAAKQTGSRFSCPAPPVHAAIPGSTQARSGEIKKAFVSSAQLAWNMLQNNSKLTGYIYLKTFHLMLRTFLGESSTFTSFEPILAFF